MKSTVIPIDQQPRWTAALLMAAAMLAVFSSHGLAQSELPGSSGAGERREQGDQPPSSSGSDLILRNAAGELELLQKDVDRAALLEWLRQQQQLRTVNEPQYDIISVELDGTADDEKARLTAKLRVQIHEADEWVSVPIGFEEATIERTQYSGPGEISLDRRQERERRWWFREAGVHELTLSLIARVRLTSPVRRVQLSIPRTASSKLTMRVPMERLTVIPPEGAWFEVIPLEQNESQIKLVGLGSRLNLQWRPQASLDRVSVSLQVESRSTLELTTDPATLTVVQTLKALQGSFQEFQAVLPKGFELKKIEETIGNDGPVFEEYEVSVEDPTKVLVRFREPVSQSVQLVWTLDQVAERKSSLLEIEPVRVINAAIDTGEYEVIALQGFRFEEVQRSEIRRVTQPIRAGYVSTTYRYATPAFRLQLDVVEVEPLVIADPVLLLRVFPDSMQLDAVYRFQLRQGAIDEIQLDWPGWRSEGWEIQPVELLTGVVVAQMNLGEGAEPISLQLQERQTGSFEVRLRAVRKLAQIDDGVSLHLPRLRTADRQSTSLLIGNADNVEATIEPLGETVVLPLSVDRISALISYFPQYLHSARQSGLRVDSVDHELLCRIDVQPQSVNVAAQIELQVLDRTVRQTLDYSVDFEPLTEVRLLLPDQLMPTDESQPLVRVTTSDGTQLPTNGAGLAVGNLHRIRFQLPEPQLGEFQIVVDYPFILPATDGELRQLRLPVIQTADGDYSEIRFRIRDEGIGGVRVSDPDWTPNNGRSSLSAWTTSANKSDIQLEVGIPAAGTTSRVTVSKGLIRSWLDIGGNNRSRAQFRMTVDETIAVPLRVPENITIDRIWWNQDPVTPLPVGDRPDSLTLPLPMAARTTGQGLLTIDFHDRRTTPFDWSETHRIEWPSFPDAIWIDQTIWEVILPSDQHLFTLPSGYTPQFEWKRAGFGWRRTPHPRFSELDDWIASQDGPAAERDVAGGNNYQFLRFGPSRPLEFRSMQWWAVVLFGAGLTWILGVILLKAPFTRHALTIPLVACLVTATAIWYPAPVQLLLQPAVLGLVLALIMAWIDAWARRSTEPVIPMGQPAEFGTSMNRVDSELAEALGVDTEESTAIRPPSYSGSSQLENSA